MRCARSIIALTSMAMLFLVCTIVRYTDEITMFVDLPTEKEDSIEPIVDFNKPLEMKVRNIKDKHAIMKQNLEKEVSTARLSDMAKILKFNSDPLPTKSAFGTTDTSQICLNDQCIPKFRHFETRIRIHLLTNSALTTFDVWKKAEKYAPKYKTMGCLMQKSLSTILQAILCFLYDETAFRKAGRVLSRESYTNRFCMHKNELNNADGNKIWKGKPNINAKWLHLAIVRDPIDRFLSGFVDKCLRKPYTPQGYCNGCQSNMTCFIISEYKRVNEEMKKKKFIRSFEDRHFFPQNWRCDFRWHFNSYKLIHYSNGPNATNEFIQQLFPLLRKQKISNESLEFIREQLTSGRTVHSTAASEARQFFEKRLKDSPFLMEYLVRLFYYDFRLFGYELPKIKFT